MNPSKIEQNKKYSVIIVIAIFAIICSLFNDSFLVFADDVRFVSFSSDVTALSHSDIITSGSHILDSVNSSSHSVSSVFAVSSSSSTVCVIYPHPVSNSSFVMFASSIPFTLARCFSQNASEVFVSSSIDPDSTYPFYYRILSTNFGPYWSATAASDSIAYYADSESDAISIASSLVGSASSLDYSLPPGNVAFVEVAPNNSFSLSTQFVEATGLFSGVFSKTSQTWGWSDSIVSSGTFPLSGHSLIPWAKGENTNLFGQSHFGVVSSVSLSGSGKYLVIYNPLYSFQTDQESNFEHNFNVNINCTAVKSITVVSLKGTLATGIESSWTLTSTPDGEIYTGEIDPDSGVPSFTDSSGNSGSPVYGGDNYIEESTQNFKGWLNGIVQSFLGVLNSGRDAILNLVSGAAAFFSVFPSLYSWLPSPVLSVLTSAMVLALAIGLIKVLL